jgi:hypothetical protein
MENEVPAYNKVINRPTSLAFLKDLLKLKQKVKLYGEFEVEPFVEFSLRFQAEYWYIKYSLVKRPEYFYH